MRAIPITEGLFPDELGDEIIVFPCGNGWGACYREEEMDDLGGFAFVLDQQDPLLAAAELVKEYPREVMA